MVPKKYHAIAFLSILVMLLLLGLHLLGFGFLGSGGQASGSAPRTAAALARNSTGSSSSLLSPTGASSTLNPNAVYRHPIAYDKLTGATNNEINDVLGGPANKQDQYPLDHYQQQSQQVRSQNPFDPQFGLQDPAAQSPFANHLARQFGPPPPGLHHAGMRPNLGPPMGLSPPLPPSRRHQLPPPLPPPPPPPVSHHQQQQQPSQLSSQPGEAASGAAAEQRHSQQQQQDSIPSASSVNNNGAARPLNASQSQYYQPLQQHQPQQPVYYTPPIFTYSNNHDSPQQQNPYQPQVPPLGVPEVPLSVDEYNARQNRLRQIGNQQHQQPSDDPATKQQQQVNLLADPQAQQRHRQQMLDRQILFGPPSLNNQPLTFMPPPPPSVDNYTAAAYYPDPALYARHQQAAPPSSSIRPPYAHQMTPQGYQQQTQLEAPSQLAPSPQQLKQLPPQSRIMSSQRPPERHAPVVSQRQQQPLVASSVVRSGHQAPSSPQTSTVAATPGLSLQEPPGPVCARQQQQQQAPFTASSLELANSTSQMPVLFCNEDPEYPTTDIMRALEHYAVDRSIELILPQQLVQMLTGSGRAGGGADNNPKLAELQRQLSLDSLQANINAKQVSSGNGNQLPKDEETSQMLGIFPTSNYDSLCRSVIWMGQPRRAKNLSGQWKVVVNLPGHKFRGIAISQMVRMEECSRPNGECSVGTAIAPSPTSQVITSASAKQTMPARSRCLQRYDNQRLLAWSNQQGLHFDIFRVPVACSCHIRRF